MVDGWRYYNHALLPNCAPHEAPDIARLENKEFWVNNTGKVLMARWTSDYDCASNQNWWYVVKDGRFDIDSLKSKRRYEINKGKKNFLIRVINPVDYVEELVEIHIKAYAQYPIQYRPVVDKEKLMKEISQWIGNKVILGAFSAEDSSLCGFAMIIENESYANFAMLKVLPICEKSGINAALVAGVLEHYNERLNKGGYYICDGERALFHETKFQDYLEKYFGFRKAYSKLHVKFRFPLSVIIKCLKPFRPFIATRSESIMKKLNVLLIYDELSE